MKKICLFLAALLLTAALVSCSDNTGKTGSDSGRPRKTEETAGAESAENKTAKTPDAAESTENTENAESTENADDTRESSAAPEGAKKFTALVRLDDDFVEFCLPEDHDGGSFTDLGANCAIMIDRYSSDVAAFHEYDSEGETVKKKVGDYTFDYQKFNYLGINNWRMYVIRIEDGYGYYRFIYNVYAEEYDDAQVEEFMKTIRIGK